MARKSKGRISKNRPLPKRVLILCEGQTEVLYFKSYAAQQNKRRKLSAVQVNVFQPKHYTPESLLKQARKQIKEERKGIPYDAVWIVFDRDIHPKIKETFQQADKEGIKIAFSAICFEFWILLHFEYTTRAFSNCDQVISHIKRQYFSDYQKTKADFFEQLKTHIPQATVHAKKIRKMHGLTENHQACTFNPYTDVDLLVDYLETICKA